LLGWANDDRLIREVFFEVTVAKAPAAAGAFEFLMAGNSAAVSWVFGA
jgi:hypothetical protein